MNVNREGTTTTTKLPKKQIKNANNPGNQSEKNNKNNEQNNNTNTKQRHYVMFKALTKKLKAQTKNLTKRQRQFFTLWDLLLLVSLFLILVAVIEAAK